METPHMATRHRFLMDESVKVEIEGTMFKGIIRGIQAPRIEVSEINPYGICADRINVIHSDAYTVILYESQPNEFNQHENTQAEDIPSEADNAQVTTQSNRGLLMRSATNPDQFEAIHHPGAGMPRLADPSVPNGYVTPYTMILYGVIPGDVATYFNNTYTMALFGISPGSISELGDRFYAQVPFGSEPHPGVYYLHPRSDIVPSYLVEIRHRLQRFDDQDEQGKPISWFDWVDDTSLGFTVLFEDKLRKDDPHPEEGSVSHVDEQGPSMPSYQDHSLETHNDL